MSELVDPDVIEGIVGIKRHQYIHYGRTVDGVVYILHSKQCRDSGIDLRGCEFSLALDNGVDETWNLPAVLRVWKGKLYCD